MSTLLVISILINWIVFRKLGFPHYNTQNLTQQIAQQQQALNRQSSYLPELDSAYKAIAMYQPQMNAVFMEVDIENQLNHIRDISGSDMISNHYQAFRQISDLYRMMYFDKKILWGQQQNRQFFSDQLESCSSGIQPELVQPSTVVSSANPSNR